LGRGRPFNSIELDNAAGPGAAVLGSTATISVPAYLHQPDGTVTLGNIDNRIGAAVMSQWRDIGFSRRGISVRLMLILPLFTGQKRRPPVSSFR
jgi:hypothetical protein